MASLVQTEAFLALNASIIVGVSDWMEAMIIVHAVGDALGGLGKAGLITIIVVSLIAIVAFVWIFRETRRRD